MKSNSTAALTPFNCDICGDKKSPAWKTRACRKKKNSPCLAVWQKRKLERKIARKKKKKVINKIASKGRKRGPRGPRKSLKPI